MFFTLNPLGDQLAQNVRAFPARGQGKGVEPLVHGFGALGTQLPRAEGFGHLGTLTLIDPARGTTTVAAMFFGPLGGALFALGGSSSAEHIRPQLIAGDHTTGCGLDGPAALGRDRAATLDPLRNSTRSHPDATRQLSLAAADCLDTPFDCVHGATFSNANSCLSIAPLMAPPAPCI